MFKSLDVSMLKPSSLQLAALCFGSLVVVAGSGCAVDSRGLSTTVLDAGGGGRDAAVFGEAGGRVGSGGTAAVGTGGVGVLGSGGAPGSGGASGSGATTGSGGVAGRGTAGAGGRANGACGPTTCPNGCCAGSTCIMNRGAQRCGNAGATCAPCGACFRCSGAGACELDPSAPWSIVCASATLLPTRLGNLLWDTQGTGMASPPDPFCQLVVDGSVVGRTTTELNTFSPAWDQSVTPNNTDLRSSDLVGQATPWTVAVIDDDGSGTLNDLACSVAPRLTDADFITGTVTFPPTQSCISLTIQLICAQ